MLNPWSVVRYNKTVRDRPFNLKGGGGCMVFVPFRIFFSDNTTLYSYLMGMDAIDQTICPEVLGMTKCSIA